MPCNPNECMGELNLGVRECTEANQGEMVRDLMKPVWAKT
jgi:hypothetical protein